MWHAVLLTTCYPAEVSIVDLASRYFFCGQREHKEVCGDHLPRTLKSQGMEKLYIRENGLQQPMLFLISVHLQHFTTDQ